MLTLCPVLIPAALDLIELHGPDGRQIIYVNPQQVTSVRQPKGVDTGHFAPGVHCLIYTTSGKFITVAESCEVVRSMLRDDGHFQPP